MATIAHLLRLFVHMDALCAPNCQKPLFLVRRLIQSRQQPHNKAQQQRPSHSGSSVPHTESDPVASSSKLPPLLVGQQVVQNG